MLDPRFQKQRQHSLKIHRRQEMRRSSSFSGYSRQVLLTLDRDTNTENSNSNPSSSRSTIEIDLEDDDAFRAQQNLLRSSSNSLYASADFSIRSKSRSTGNLGLLLNEETMPYPAEDDEDKANLALGTLHRSLGVNDDSSTLFTTRSADWTPPLGFLSTSSIFSEPPRHVRVLPAEPRRPIIPATARPSSFDKDGKVLKRSVTELSLSFKH